MKRAALSACALFAVIAIAFGAYRAFAPWMAKLAAKQGSVTASRRGSPTRFVPIDVGAVFNLGDAVRTGASSTARLHFDDGSVLDVRPRSTVRFSASRPGVAAPRIEVVEGEAVLTVKAERDVDTRAGPARLGERTRVVLRASDGEVELFVSFGTARLESGARTTILSANQGTAIGRVATEPDPTTPASATRRPTAAEGLRGSSGTNAANAGAESNEAEVAGAASTVTNVLADHVDVALDLGRSPTIRDLSPPTALGLSTGTACTEGAAVEQLAGSSGRVNARALGRGVVPVSFREGSTRYQVRCLVGGVAGRVVSQGRVRIVRSSGQAPLPRTAPTARIEADGRTYDVLFQNRLPNLTILWPNGPSGSGTLVVDVGSRTQRFRTRGPEHGLPAGTLGEGTHRVHFENGRRRSREAIVNVRFDSGSPSAALESPPDGSFAPGSRVRVAGVALAGWNVTVDGRSIRVGADRRFEGEAEAPANGVLVVRLAKPGQSDQLFVRRARRTGG